MKKFVILSLGVLLSAAPEFAQAALSLPQAKAIAAKATQAAAKRGLTVTVALVDEGGNLLYLERMDGTYVGSVDAAVAKAKSSNGFRRPTKVFEDGVASGRGGLLSIPGVVAIEGGLPIVVEGTPVGGIGVSGAKAAEDGEIAAAAL